MNYKIIDLFVIALSFLLSCCKDKSTNPAPIVIPSVTICSQTWMTKNLDVDHYRNGDPIPEVNDSTTWVNLTTGAWCYYNNDPAMGAIYGKLYNWYAVNDPRGLASVGWHVPSDDEWTVLITCLGGDSIAAGKLKEAGLSHWQTPNAGTTNESGFTALPGGGRGYGGAFIDIGGSCCLWSSTEGGVSNVWCRYLYYYNAYIYRHNYEKNDGLSVRCVKD